MTHRMYRALVASVGAVALMLAAGETFARPGAAAHGRSTAAHSISHRSFTQSFRHRGRNNNDNGGIFWPDDGFYGEPSGGEPVPDVSQSASGDVHYTYQRDVPWDWAHRFPPAVAPSDRPYVPSYPAESVTVPGHGGQDQTVNITRCY
jgi:hypothetical protein